MRFDNKKFKELEKELTELDYVSHVDFRFQDNLHGHSTKIFVYTRNHITNEEKTALLERMNKTDYDYEVIFK